MAASSSGTRGSAPRRISGSARKAWRKAANCPAMACATSTSKVRPQTRSSAGLSPSLKTSNSSEPERVRRPGFAPPWTRPILRHATALSRISGEAARCGRSAARIPLAARSARSAANTARSSATEPSRSTARVRGRSGRNHDSSPVPVSSWALAASLNASVTRGVSQTRPIQARKAAAASSGLAVRASGIAIR